MTLLHHQLFPPGTFMRKFGEMTPKMFDIPAWGGESVMPESPGCAKVCGPFDFGIVIATLEHDEFYFDAPDLKQLFYYVLDSRTGRIGWIAATHVRPYERPFG